MSLRKLIGRYETQAEAARALGVSQSAISHYLSGRRRPALAVAQRMVRASRGALTLDMIYGLARRRQA